MQFGITREEIKTKTWKLYADLYGYIMAQDAWQEGSDAKLGYCPHRIHFGSSYFLYLPGCVVPAAPQAASSRACSLAAGSKEHG